MIKRNNSSFQEGRKGRECNHSAQRTYILSVRTLCTIWQKIWTFHEKDFLWAIYSYNGSGFATVVITDLKSLRLVSLPCCPSCCTDTKLMKVPLLVSSQGKCNTRDNTTAWRELQGKNKNNYSHFIRQWSQYARKLSVAWDWFFKALGKQGKKGKEMNLKNTNLKHERKH